MTAPGFEKCLRLSGGIGAVKIVTMPRPRVFLISTGWFVSEEARFYEGIRPY